MRTIPLLTAILCVALAGCRGRSDNGAPQPVVDSPDSVAVAPRQPTTLRIDGLDYAITPDWYSRERGTEWGINGTITGVVRKQITIYGLPYGFRSDFFSPKDLAELGRRGIVLSDPHKTLTAYKLLCDTLSGSGSEVLRTYDQPAVSQEQIDALSRSGVDAVRAYNSPFLSQEQVDTINASTGNCGIADIWLVSFKKPDGQTGHFVILDKITPACSKP